MTRSGFTLIELCIVILLIGLILGLSVSFGSYHQAYMVRAELHRLGAYVHMVRQLALMDDATHRIHLNAQHHSYQSDDQTIQLTPGVQFGFLPGTLGPPGSPKERITNAISFKHHTIECFGDGTTSSGSVYMIDARARHMYAMTIAVTDVPYVRFYRYDTAWVAI